MIELLLALVMPFLVAGSTQAVKGVRAIAMAASWRVPVIRAIVAVLSLVGAILTASIDGGTIGEGMVETTALTVFNAVAATFIYFKTKR